MKKEKIMLARECLKDLSSRVYDIECDYDELEDCLISMYKKINTTKEVRVISACLDAFEKSLQEIEMLKRENFGLRKQVENMKRKEEDRYKSDAWVDR